MPVALRAIFRGALNAELRDFMDEIEARSGKQIDVVHLPPDVTAPMSMRCHARAIQIEIPRSNAVHLPAAVHELQHMERYLVHGVPAIGSVDHPSDPNDRRRIGLLDNPIEHLVIVPEATRFNMREEAYWNAQVRNGWLGIDNSGPDYFYDRRQYVLLQWLATHLATDLDVISFAERTLANEGPDVEAATRAVRNDALENLHDKVELTRIVMAGLNIPRDRVQLQIFDKASQSFTYQPLP